MAYKGHVENGVIVLDDEVSLQEGVVVVVQVVDSPEDQTSGNQRAPKSLTSLIGVLDDMPADLSENHDAYMQR